VSAAGRRGFSSRRLWSLWDIMQKIDTAFADDLVVLGKTAQLLFQLPSQMPPELLSFLRQTIKTRTVHARGFLAFCKEAGLILSEIKAKELIQRFSAVQKASDDKMYEHLFNIRETIDHLTSRIRDEMETFVFITIQNKYTAFYEPPEPLFGNGVATQFSSLAYDIQEAGKCLALGRSTAAVFHVIRCLEGAILALSRCLRIPDPIKAADRNWGAMLRLVKGEVDRRWPTSTDRLGGDGQAFDELYGALAGLQNPYRNATMHLDKVYTEEDANHTFELVRGLMRRVASRCDEDGEPKLP
jgi:hypothetical protein